VFGVFAICLAVYIWLLFNGPNIDSAEGLRVQVTGQKLIAYAAIITTLIQAYGAIHLLEREAVAAEMPVSGVVSD
jgi:hypothetical protein